MVNASHLRDYPPRPATGRLMMNKSLREPPRESSNKANYGFQPIGTSAAKAPKAMIEDEKRARAAQNP